MDRSSLVGLNHFKEKAGILIIEAQTPQKANEITSEILEKYSDSKTALFLSGGKTPKHLFKAIAVKRCLRAGAVLMVDERFGKKFHKNSNELMIKNTGIIEYFENQNVRFYPILQENQDLSYTASQYDETLRFILKYFPKTLGLLGLGEDGHTAGIPARTQKSKLKTSAFAKAPASPASTRGVQRGESADKQNLSETTKRILNDQSSLVTYYEDESGVYGARITMTFMALSQLDLILILVLGKEKREALKLMFTEARLPVPASPLAKQSEAARDLRDGGQGSIEEIPARFYLKPEIAAKTILITDQIV